VKTDELIVQLARSLEPIEPLPSVSARLAAWTTAALSIAAAVVFVIGPRTDIASAIRQPAFATLAMMASLTAIASAALALVSSVPGAESHPVQRGVPFFLATGWGLTLTAMLIGGGAPIARLMALPIHAACVIQITGVAVIPGWTLLGMLRRAAPLRATWSAVLAALAASALGAAATQIICPVDDPAHLLIGHFVPMAVLTIGATAATRRSLTEWRERAI
jgi:hypothetical protein